MDGPSDYCRIATPASIGVHQLFYTLIRDCFGGKGF
jgi:hypothetical protein